MIAKILTSFHFDRVQEKADAIRLMAGYTVAGGGVTAPMWIADLTGWFSLFAAFLGVVVGATTLYINLLTIKKKHKE